MPVFGASRKALCHHRGPETQRLKNVLRGTIEEAACPTSMPPTALTPESVPQGTLSRPQQAFELCLLYSYLSRLFPTFVWFQPEKWDGRFFSKNRIETAFPHVNYIDTSPRTLLPWSRCAGSRETISSTCHRKCTMSKSSSLAPLDPPTLRGKGRHHLPFLLVL
jgi:hypothetical protein